MQLWTYICDGCVSAKEPADAPGEEGVIHRSAGTWEDEPQVGVMKCDEAGFGFSAQPQSRENSRLESQGPACRRMMQRIENLQEVEIFHRLPIDELETLALAFTTALYEIGEVVIREGDMGSDFYLIQAGQAHVSVAADPSFSVQLGQGHWFGEKALLFDMPRMATVTAATNMAVLKLSREKFRELRLNEKIFSLARKCMHGESHERVNRPTVTQSQLDTRLIVEALKANKNVQRILESHSDAELLSLAKTAVLQTVPGGKVLIEQGSTSAEDDCFYIVKSGRFAVFQGQGHTSSRTTRISMCQRAEIAAAHATSDAAGFANSLAQESSVFTVVPGMSFGELALLHAAPRNASVQAMEESEVFAIDRTSFRVILEMAASAKLKIEAGYLRKVALFEKLTEQELGDLAACMQEFRYEKGDVILQQGAEGDIFYVMVDGTVGVYKDQKRQTELSASWEEGTSQCFGERALLQNEPRAATVKVLSETARLLSVDRESFKFLLANQFEVISTGNRPTKEAQKPKLTIQDLMAKRMSYYGTLRRKELKKEGTLGFGALGIIDLMQHRESGARYALKVMNKGYITKWGLQQKVLHTRDVLIVLHSPFIANLVEAYSGSQSLYFLMECCLGGDLLTVYNRMGFHGSLPHCKFYVASVIMAFEHMHRLKIIYRDTKPENILVDSKGTLKIADLDCAKFCPGKTHTVCGTPEYMAPEVMSMTGHSFMVDWWGVGVLCFELLVGFTPFLAQSPMNIYARVSDGISKVKFPRQVTGVAEEFIKALLVHNPSHRLPAKPQGVQQMKKMQFWHALDWTGIRAGTAKPPHVPDVEKRAFEAARFRPRPEDMPPQIVYNDDGSGWEAGFATAL